MLPSASFSSGICPLSATPSLHPLRGRGLEDQAASLNIPLAGALTSHRGIQQLLHFRASE